MHQTKRMISLLLSAVITCSSPPATAYASSVSDELSHTAGKLHRQDERIKRFGDVENVQKILPYLLFPIHPEVFPRVLSLLRFLHLEALPPVDLLPLSFYLEVPLPPVDPLPGRRSVASGII